MTNVDVMVSKYIKEYLDINKKLPKQIMLPVGFYNMLVNTTAFRMQNAHLNVNKPLTYDGVEVVANNGEMWVTK